MLFHVLRHMNSLKPQFDKTLEVKSHLTNTLQNDQISYLKCFLFYNVIMIPHRIIAGKIGLLHNV